MHYQKALLHKFCILIEILNSDSDIFISDSDEYDVSDFSNSESNCMSEAASEEYLSSEEDYLIAVSSKKKIYNRKFTSTFYLKLLNNSNSCYCNSIVQAILSLNITCLTRVSLLFFCFFDSLLNNFLFKMLRLENNKTLKKIFQCFIRNTIMKTEKVFDTKCLRDLVESQGIYTY